MSQRVEHIRIDDLHLWSENPRDHVDSGASDFDIISRAIGDSKGKWNLDKLIIEMGEFYDFSELPTVVIVDGKNIVYDGNRRVAAIKCIQNNDLYTGVSGRLLSPAAPEQIKNLIELPCNVCDKETALDSIERKHFNHGSWGPLERDYFMHVHRNKEKSDFIKFEEATGLISANEKILNTRYAKDELLKTSKLEEIGFKFDNDKLVSNYEQNVAEAVLKTIVDSVDNKKTDTRHNRGELKKAILEQDPDVKDIVRSYDDTSVKFEVPQIVQAAPLGRHNVRKTPVSTKNNELFGGALELCAGRTNDIYRGIDKIWQQNKGNDASLALVCPIICISLRLLLEVAAQEYYKHINDNSHGDNALRDFAQLAKSDFRQLPIDTLKNDFSLLSGWINSSDNLKTVYDKWAHGTLSADRDLAIRESKIIAEILKKYHSKEKL